MYAQRLIACADSFDNDKPAVEESGPPDFDELPNK